MQIIKRLAQVRVQQQSLSAALEDSQQYEKQLLQQHADDARLFANGFAFKFRGRAVTIKGATADYTTEERIALIITYSLVFTNGEDAGAIREDVLGKDTAHRIAPQLEAVVKTN